MAHYHFIGIGGTGLAPIARVLLEKGHEVSGSDRQLSDMARDLQALGVTIFIGHDARNIAGAEMVIRSSAIKDENPEVQAAMRAQIPVLKRSEFLKHLIAGQTCIAIAGTHGKTTTTAMAAWVLTSMGLDPSYVIGGVSKNLHVNGHYGKGKYFVIEADEYDYMFYGLAPALEVVTHVEHDHPDLFPTPEAYRRAFEGFVSRLLPNGNLLLCGDDPGALSLRSVVKTARRVSTYGIVSGSEFRATNLSINSRGGFDFDAVHIDRERFSNIGHVSLGVPGKHNVLNALAVLAITHILLLSTIETVTTLQGFSGVSRRFDILGEANGITVVDDYAHHPTEIRATLSAARDRFPNRRIWAVWQPHTFTRTISLEKDFVSAFEDADQVLVTEIYAARETKETISAKQLVDAMPSSKTRFVPSLENAITILQKELKSGDVLLVLSAGDADQVSSKVLEILRGRK
jgi:UDP-N-acetylmuramate--alanine ligase